MAKYLITGAAGFIGSQLAYRLWKNGEKVVGIDDFSYGKEDNLIFPEHDFRKEIRKIDITDKSTIDSLFEMEKFDYVYHVAAITPLPDCQMNPSRALKVNVVGTANILEAARLYGVNNIIFASTSAVYENNTVFPCKEGDIVSPHLTYSSSKIMGEMLCRNYVNVYGMNITVLRFANVYGPHLDCLRKQPPVAGYLIREYFYNRVPELHSTGEQARDFIFVEDLIDLAILVKDNKGYDCVNVSSNTTHTINEMDRIIAQLMGKENVVPNYREVNHFWGNYPLLYEGAYPIAESVLEKEVVKHTECDNNHAKDKYGWSPRVEFSEGIRRTVEFAIKQLSNIDSGGAKCDEIVEIAIKGNVVKVYSDMLTDDLKKVIGEFSFSGKGNKVLIGKDAKISSSCKIEFLGSNNILFLHAKTEINGTNIKFQGNNSLIYLTKASTHPFKKCNFITGHESVIYIGKNMNVNPVDFKRFLAIEHQNIIIGEDCLFSNDLMLRTNDAHIIYDISSKKRTNYSGSIWIGDHVWIARGATILKNTQIGSGSVIGAGTLLGNKRIPSNTLAAGVPCKIIKSNIVMDRRSTSNMTLEETEKYSELGNDMWIYSRDESSISMYEIDALIKEKRTADEKLEIVKHFINGNTNKNRFFL